MTSRTKYGFFDFETYGGFGIAKRGIASEVISPLCCAIRYDHHNPNGPTDVWVYDKKDPKAVAIKALKSLALHTEHCETFYAHNMGRFDGLLLASAAMQLGWKFQPILAGASRVIGFEFFVEGKRVDIRDTFALVPESLKNIATDFQLASAKEFNADDYKGDMRDLSIQKLRKGCFADCQVGLELLDKLETFVQDSNGSLRRTFSATALGIVKANLEATAGRKVPSHFDYPHANPVARKSYYGGRVEVLKHTPRNRLSGWDINSSYPAAMCQDMPWEPLAFVEGKKAHAALLDGTMGIYKAQVDTPEMQYPVLPYKPTPESAVFFPVGAWEGWFPGNELLYAITQGVKVKVIAASLYTTERRPFADFVEGLYEQRRLAKAAGHKAKATFLKYILNGCYGKFGEKPEHNKATVFETSSQALDYMHTHEGCTVIDECRCEEKTALPCPTCGRHERMLSFEEFRWASHTQFAIASYNTGGGRIALHKEMLNTTGLAYVDTDGTNGEHWSGVETDKLGGMKLVQQQGKKDEPTFSSFHGTYYAPKIYRLTPYIPGATPVCAAKGFPMGNEVFDSIINTAREWVKTGAKPTRGVKVERTRLFRTQMKQGGNEMTRLVQEKCWRGWSTKRKPIGGPDGDTAPWSVDELRAGAFVGTISPAIEGV